MRLTVWSLLAVVCGACGGDAAESSTLPGGQLIGRIEQADNVPLGDCQVLLEGVPLGSRCDAAGIFDIRQVPPGRWDLRIIADPDALGSALPARRIPAAANPGFVTDLGAIRVARAGAVGGRVIDSEGADLPFAIIAVPSFGVVTAPNPNGGYLMDVVPPGVHDVVLTTLAGDVLRADVLIEPGQTTIGIDFDIADVEGGAVEVSGSAYRRSSEDHGGLHIELVEILDGARAAEATTDDQGSFSMSVSSGVYLLRASDGVNPIVATIPFVVVSRANGATLELGSVVVLEDEGDLDGDGVADADDPDIDGDGVVNQDDAFPYDPAESADSDGDGVGDNSDLRSLGGDGIDHQVPTLDSDDDGRFDFEDNCPATANSDQNDRDGDGVGDLCDNCPGVPNPDQLDSVADGTGDACRACVDGHLCIPQESCHLGFMSCTAGGPVCVDSGAIVASGTPCGEDLVCNNGTCGPCLAGDSCQPATEPCNQGVVQCDTGVAECVDISINAANGTICGADQVCYGGDCEPCQESAACPVAADPCHQGALACSSGQPVCNATTTPVEDGTVCGASLFCYEGACMACAEGEACAPADPCHAGTISCGTGQPICADSGSDAPDGTVCDVGKHCSGGSCMVLPNSMTLVQGDGQSEFAGAVLAPVVIELRDGGDQPLAGETVTFTAPVGATVTPASAVTNSSGQVTLTPRLGPTLGAQSFAAATATAPPVSIAATATAPPSGGSVTVVNADHVNGEEGIPGPASAARVGTLYGPAVAADGTIYFADYNHHRVYAITPAGQIEVVAGNGDGGFTNDLVLATSTRIYYPTGVELDEAGGRLFIADTSNNRIRVVYLDTGIIDTYAGGGSAPGPGYGDGGAATSASLSSPRQPRMGPDGALYLADRAHNRIRRVDPVTGVITTLAQAEACVSETIGWNSCGTLACGFAFDDSGALFLGATLCGSETNGVGPGIIRRDPDGSLHHIAGRAGGVVGDGVDARLSLLDQVTDLVFDSSGNLLFSEPVAQRIRRIDARTRLISAVVGNGVAGVADEYADAATSPSNSPASMAFDGADLVVAESANCSLRRVPAVDIAAPTAATLALGSGDGQSTAVANLTPLALGALLQDGVQPLAGVLVDWAPVDPGVALYGVRVATASDGVAQSSMRPGLLPATYQVIAELLDIHGAHIPGSPVSFSTSALAPAADTVFAILNTDGVAEDSGVPGPSTLAHDRSPQGVAIAADGTIYYSSYSHKIRRISPVGEVTTIGGTGAATYSGDFGPAVDAAFFYPSGLALDEAGQLLYIADESSGRVRVIDLASGIVTTVAGGGSAPSPQFGDGGPAVNSVLSNPTHVSIGDDGALYIGDDGHGRIRRVDRTTGLITAFVEVGNCTDAVAFAGCAAEQCAMAWDGSGGVYITGAICGTVPGNTGGILHRSSGGVLTHIAGNGAGTTTDGILATQYRFPSAQPQGIARDGPDLYVVSTQRIVRISGGTITTYAGDGTAGCPGGYVSAASTRYTSLTHLAFTADGHLVVPDANCNNITFSW